MSTSCNYRYFPCTIRNWQQNGSPHLQKETLRRGHLGKCKEILGWMIDDTTGTISLPQHKCEKILLELKAIRRSKCIPSNQLETQYSKLTFTAIAIQVSKPLLGQIDKLLAMATKANFNNITVNDIVNQYCTT